jgi:hypothetical protein
MGFNLIEHLVIAFVATAHNSVFYPLILDSVGETRRSPSGQAGIEMYTYSFFEESCSYNVLYRSILAMRAKI